MDWQGAGPGDWQWAGPGDCGAVLGEQTCSS